MANDKQWGALEALAADMANTSLSDMFESDPKRAKTFSYSSSRIFADFSKQRINKDVMDGLMALARQRGLETWRESLFAGDEVNPSEGRPALHMTLRGSTPDLGHHKAVVKMRRKMSKFADKVRRGAYQGADNRPFRNIVHIGIGGSDLGPRLIADALKATTRSTLNLRFANNVDAASINDALEDLDPAETLIIIVSKSFTTQETQMNGERARQWLKKKLGKKQAGKQIVAVTANRPAAEEMGLKSKFIFDFWDWVGGRYSLWSAVGLSLEIAFGSKAFAGLLDGASKMDQHFRDMPLEKNLPVIMGLVGVWNRNFLNYSSVCVAPYSRRLRKFSAFLQQLEMESNGKTIGRDGKPVPVTCPIIWGDEGTNGQHAFFQWLHQGPKGAPVDFVVPLKDHEKTRDHHVAVLANCFAQSEALMKGKTEDEVRAELKDSGLKAKALEALVPQKVFDGNRPSTTLVLDNLSPEAIGNLIALYEHKVFVQSVIWGNNAYDQWGVELGKVMAKTILNELDGGEDQPHDSSTAQLIKRAKKSL